MFGAMGGGGGRGRKYSYGSMRARDQVRMQLNQPNTTLIMDVFVSNVLTPTTMYDWVQSNIPWTQFVAEYLKL